MKVKTNGFVYKCKQSSPWTQFSWTQFFTENNQRYNIREHKDYFTWAECFVMLFMYGGRFLSVESLENIFTQSLFGKNVDTKLLIMIQKACYQLKTQGL